MTGDLAFFQQRADDFQLRLVFVSTDLAGFLLDGVDASAIVFYFVEFDLLAVDAEFT
ncbi:hypothetical protein ACWEKT_26725 [Nocardia takedensis]